MEKRKLTTFRSVVKALGGVHAVAALTKRSPQGVCNWRARGTFPSRFYLVISSELTRLGYETRPSLFGQETSSVNRHVTSETNAEAA